MANVSAWRSVVNDHHGTVMLLQRLLMTAPPPWTWPSLPAARLTHGEHGGRSCEQARCHVEQKRLVMGPTHWEIETLNPERPYKTKDGMDLTPGTVDVHTRIVVAVPGASPVYQGFFCVVPHGTQAAPHSAAWLRFRCEVGQEESEPTCTFTRLCNAAGVSLKDLAPSHDVALDAYEVLASALLKTAALLDARTQRQRAWLDDVAMARLAQCDVDVDRVLRDEDIGFGVCIPFTPQVPAALAAASALLKASTFSVQ